MKTILILTDFSDNAGNAANIALDFACKLNANLLLLNAYPAPLPVLSTAEAGNWPDEENAALRRDFKADLAGEKVRLASLLANKTSTLTIRTIMAEGPVGNNIGSVVKNRKVDLVIMGGRDKSVNDFLFGSDTKDVMKKAGCPVLIVPKDIKGINFEVFTFLTDLSLGDLKTIVKFRSLFNALTLHITVAHVSKPVFIADFREDNIVANFMSRLAALQLQNVSYRNLRGDNIVAEIDKLNELVKANIMAMVYRKHSCLWNIFFRSRCKVIIDAQKLPLLIFPDI
ncbi:universal stress protein [Mucilaginibacter aquariorum]|uniref:Universal stress protein n=1 Tax=Mucilaginibacter aquariorum TaxID=2967225 RepID=A0ABT1T3Q1_9SPHI|nr:universal stress protein [Mucilaginibacter aquariorum]MCQ6959194.1 universal stress protein [Mucilaginibacter aquariorum]